MKKHKSFRPFFTAVSLAVALAWLPQSLAAENKSLLPVESAKSGYDLEIKDGQLVNAPKGRGTEATLGNVVDALRDQYTTANIVLAPGLAKLKISDLKLRAGHLADELEAIRVASGAKFDWMGPGSAGPNIPPSLTTKIDPTTGQPTAAAAAESNTGLFVVREPAPTPETERTVEAFNIGPYFQWLREKQDPKEAQDHREQEVAKNLNELEQIIQVTLNSLKQGGPVEMPSFRFHRGANLLIVTGTRDAVEVARKVVNALPEQSGSSGMEAGGAGGSGFEGMSPELRKRYGLLPSTPAPSR